MTIEDVRNTFAERLQADSHLQSARLVEAFARVPRERFLGAGPWTIRREGAPGAVPTDDADPRHLYQNVAVAIDPARELYNGQPGQIGGWIDALQVAPGERVLHIGCGTGYYTAILADIVGSSGRVFAVEVDPDLAARAATNLTPWPWAHVAQGDGSSALPEHMDVVVVHAGASHVRDEWLDATRDGARLVMMLTCTLPGLASTLGKGMMLNLHRVGSEWRARLSSMVVSYSLVGGRDDAMNAALGQALMTGRMTSVTGLRRDPHERAPTCWLHAPTNCLTMS